MDKSQFTNASSFPFSGNSVKNGFITLSSSVSFRVTGPLSRSRLYPLLVSQVIVTKH